jgi:diguanylate cyclase (GGDEF)-like protein/PAS domain S-box-containing protein
VSTPLRILFIEDVPTDMEIAVRQLRQHGIECVSHRVATSPALRTALAEFEPDVILGDYSLPGFDGASALALARELRPETPFIFFSGTIGEERAIEALKNGAADYVLKSQPGRLGPAVRRAVDDSAAARAARAVDQRLRDIVDTAQDWIWELDASGAIVFSSESLLSALGYEANNVIGVQMTDLLLAEDVERMRAAMHELERQHRRYSELELRARHRDGSVRWLERRLLALIGSDGRVCGWRGADRDITDRRLQEAQIARLGRVLKMLNGVNGAIARIRERRSLLTEACRLATQVGGYSTAVVVLITPGTRSGHAVASAGVDERVLADIEFNVATPPDPDTSICGRVLRTGVPFACNDLLQLDERMRETAHRVYRESRAAAGLPLVVDNTTVGVLVLASRETDVLAGEEMAMLRELAANLSFGLQYLQKDDVVKFLSYFDQHTGLARRPLFMQRVERMAAAPNCEATLAAAVLDIDHLGALNDTFGRHVGDLLLQRVADRLRSAVPDRDCVAHLGGGTFAIAQDVGSGGEADVRTLVDKCMHRVFATPFMLEERSVPVTGRCGFAWMPARDLDPAELLQNAETALRAAKAGREPLQPYRSDLLATQSLRLSLEHRLRAALERGEFELHYQPKVGVRTREIQGVEALIRWRDPQEGLVSPARFLPALEASGLIVEVGDWLTRQAAEDCRRWQSAGLPAVRIAINASPLQLQRRDFVERFMRHAADANGYSLLDVEVTEGLLLEDAHTAVDQLRELRRHGAAIAIDDFGTGYSSLSRLAELPIDVLKIDRGFVAKLDSDPVSGRKLVGTVIGLARAFGMKVVAEGVESETQLAELWQLHCDEAQGYLHSRPLPAGELLELLRCGRDGLIRAVAAAGARPAARHRRSRGEASGSGQ